MRDALLTTEKAANYGARAGEVIAGNLARGAAGQFTSAGNAAAKKPLAQSIGAKRTARANAAIIAAAKRRAAAKPKKGRAKAKPKAAAKPKATSGAAEQRRAEAAKRRQARQADAVRRKAEQATAKIKRDQERAAAQAKRLADREATKITRAQERAKRVALAAQRRAATGGGGKGGAKAKPSKVAQQELKREQNRSKVQSATLDRPAFDALISLAGGEQPDPPGPSIDALIKIGLVERDTSGLIRISGAGRSYTNAADRGDIGRANDAMSRARDRVAERSKRKTTKEYVPTYAIYKQANGRYRWVGVSSTAYQDRDKQYVSLKALQDDVDRADQDGRPLGPLRYWHMPGVDIGTTDYNAVVGRSLIESGEFHDNRVAEAIDASPEPWQMSLGFLHGHDQPQGDTYTSIRRFERSILPASAASNPFTSLQVYKGDTMGATPEEKMAKLKELVGDGDLLAKLLAGVESTEKEADAAGVRYKEADAGGAEVEEKAAEEVPDEAAAEDAAGEMEAEAESILTQVEIDAIASAVFDKLAPLLGTATTKAMQPDLIDRFLGAVVEVQKEAQGASAKADQASVAADVALRSADAKAAEIATLKQRLASLEGDQPAGNGYRASQATETITEKQRKGPMEAEAFLAAADFLLK